MNLRIICFIKPFLNLLDLLILSSPQQVLLSSTTYLIEHHFISKSSDAGWELYFVGDNPQEDIM